MFCLIQELLQTKMDLKKPKENDSQLTLKIQSLIASRILKKIIFQPKLEHERGICAITRPCVSRLHSHLNLWGPCGDILARPCVRGGLAGGGGRGGGQRAPSLPLLAPQRRRLQLELKR